MHRARVNQCDIAATITAKSLFSILDGRYSKRTVKNGPQYVILDGKEYDAAAELRWLPAVRFPNSIPVSSNTSEELLAAMTSSNTQRRSSPDLLQNLNTLDYYIPGSSLRGMMRSYAEKILRSLSPGENQPFCCDPFADTENTAHCFCGKHLENYNGGRVYRLHCPICAIFGSTRMVGRIRVEDSKLTRRGRTVVRDSVPLNRHTGAVVQGVGPFSNLLLEDYSFSCRITLINFQCWHLGLIAYLLRDLCRGELRLGWGKSKAYGAISATVDNVRLHYYGRSALVDATTGVRGIEHLGYDSDIGVKTYSLHLDPGIIVVEPDELPFRRSFRVVDPGMDLESPFWNAMAISFYNAFRYGFSSLDILRSSGD
jgi:CRISPR/Cas system CSM-associated protein Csm3 (group 7 of RAMP superfamily)